MRRLLLMLTVAALMTMMLALSAVPAFAAEATWDEEERGEPGKFSFQLILDGGAEEHFLEDQYWDELMDSSGDEDPAEEMDAEDPLF